MPTSPPVHLFKGQSLIYNGADKQLPVLFVSLRPHDQIMGGVPGHENTTALVQLVDGRCFKTTMDKLSIPEE